MWSAPKMATINEIVSGAGVTVDGVNLKDGGITATSTITGTAITTTGTRTGSGLDIDTPTDLSVTNGQVITVSAGKYVLTGVGSPNDNTNTVTVANGTKGTEVRFMVSAASTNLVKFADSGNLRLSGDAILDNFDTLDLDAISATNWVEVGQVNN